MPIRFSTEAANADKWMPDGQREAQPVPAASRGNPAYDRPAPSRAGRSNDASPAGKPDKGTNAVSYLKDPSSPSPD